MFTYTSWVNLWILETEKRETYHFPSSALDLKLFLNCVQNVSTFHNVFYPMGNEIDWFGDFENTFDFRFWFFDFVSPEGYSKVKNHARKNVVAFVWRWNTFSRVSGRNKLRLRSVTKKMTWMSEYSNHNHFEIHFSKSQFFSCFPAIPRFSYK